MSIDSNAHPSPCAAYTPRFTFDVKPDNASIECLVHDLDRYSNAGEPRPRWRRAIDLLLGYGAAVLVFAALAAEAFRRNDGSIWLGATLGAAFGGIVAWGAHRKFVKDGRKFTREFIANALEPGFRLEVSDDGVRMDLGLGAIVCDWRGVRSVRRAGPIILFETWAKAPLPLAPRDFADSAQADAFMAYATRQINAAGGGEAGFLRRHLATADAPCPRCRYALRGCDGTACPECGLALTLAVLGLRSPRTIADLKVADDATGANAPPCASATPIPTLPP